jgi:hypothetical protein
MLFLALAFPGFELYSKLWQLAKQMKKFHEALRAPVYSPR